MSQTQTLRHFNSHTEMTLGEFQLDDVAVAPIPMLRSIIIDSSRPWPEQEIPVARVEILVPGSIRIIFKHPVTCPLQEPIGFCDCDVIVPAFIQRDH